VRRSPLLVFGLLACSGTIEGPRPDGPGGGTGGGDVTPAEPERPTSAIPRLSRREVDASLESVFGITGAALRNLPADPSMSVNPRTLAEEEVFDTLAPAKEPNQVFVEGLESLAFEVGRDFSANTSAVNALAGCAPSGAALDVACLSKLIDVVASRLWRRPIADDERAALVQLATTASALDPPRAHAVGVRAVVMTLVQSPEFVYRTELGQPVQPGLVRLDDRELVSRLAAFLWGSAPSPAMLQRVAMGPLDDAAVVTLVDSMLDDPRATTQMRTFHQLWLRYPGLLVTDPALATDMRAESDALVNRALLTSGTPWTTLFSSTQSWLTPRLSTHYGLPMAPASGGWVNVDGPRAGLLSHGSFLSLSSTRVTDTLPSRRGAMVARRVLCQNIPPPPKDVNIDNGVMVAPGACKPAAYAAHARSSCAGCHASIDGVGFGFERLDGLGRLRSVEDGNSSCTIDGTGRVGEKPFNGVRDFVTQNEATMTWCAVHHLATFGFRDRTLGIEHVTRFNEAFVSSGYDFRALMRTIALDPRFRVRVDEVAP
jgi:hypothetical protein